MERIKRDIEASLVEWKDKSKRSPLIIRGARQIGKTETIRHFSQTQFDQCLEVNFEKNPEIKAFFQTFDVVQILNHLELHFDHSIQDGKTIIFFDEIQECPNALMALRYFKEDRPNLHVIAAGSLLEFLLHDDAISMPVGRVQFMYMKPVSFSEFLSAINMDKIRQFLKSVTLDTPVDPTLHTKLVNAVRTYLLLGGMPEAIAVYLETKSIREAQIIQLSILTTYKQDFIKYVKVTDQEMLRKIFEHTPKLLGNQIKYTHFNIEKQSRTIKAALLLLKKAGVIEPITHTNASGIPVGVQEKDAIFKLLFLDVGLAQSACNIDGETMLSDDILQINNGAIAEQFVGQELLAYQDEYKKPKLHFWKREKKGSQAEVDYLYLYKNAIIPIEVKAGKTGRLKSIQVFLEEKKQKIGIKLSTAPLEKNGNILSVPLYLINQLPILLKETVK